MANRKSHKTHLRMFRRRTGFSQGEVAFLLGGFNGTTVSRHECSGRLPLLNNALMYELIFDVRMRELYPVTYSEARAVVTQRARGLHKQLAKRAPGRSRDRKLAVLKRLFEEDVAPAA
jgi:DNA-binding XRE family transcriptional regulator